MRESTRNHNRSVSRFLVVSAFIGGGAVCANQAGAQTTTITLDPVRWTDRLGNTHEAKNTNLDFFDYNSIFGETGLDTFLGNAATNGAGSVTFNTNRDDFGSTIEFYTYVRAAIPGIGYVKANFADAEPYREIFPVGGPGVATLDVTEGATASFAGHTADNTNLNNIGTAIGFVQALGFMGNYYNNTHAAAVPFITVEYRSDIASSAYYDTGANTPRIALRYGAWGAWDVLMHEYGHHIATSKGFDTCAGGGHSHGVNNIGALEQGAAADPGAKLAWSEGVATHLALMANHHGNLAGYFATALPAQDTDSNYDSYQSTSSVTNETHLQFRYSVETKISSIAGRVPRGEGDEWAVGLVLWDFYDSGPAGANAGNENYATGVNRNDQASFGATKLFQVMDTNNTVTLRDLWHAAGAAAIADPTLVGLAAGADQNLVLGTLGEILEENTIASRPLTSGFIADDTPQLVFTQGNDDRSGSYAIVVFDSNWDLVTSVTAANALNSAGNLSWDVNIALNAGEQYWWATLNTSALYGATQPSLVTDIDKWYWSGLNPLSVPEPASLGVALLAAPLALLSRRRRA